MLTLMFLNYILLQRRLDQKANLKPKDWPNRPNGDFKTSSRAQGCNDNEGVRGNEL